MTTRDRGTRCLMKDFGLAALLLIAAAGAFAPPGTAGNLPDATASHHRKMMALSIKIAQGEGDEGKIRKYKSLARQHRSGKCARVPDQSSRKTRFAPW